MMTRTYRMAASIGFLAGLAAGFAPAAAQTNAVGARLEADPRLSAMRALFATDLRADARRVGAHYFFRLHCRRIRSSAADTRKYPWLDALDSCTGSIKIGKVEVACSRASLPLGPGVCGGKVTGTGVDETRFGPLIIGETANTAPIRKFRFIVKIRDRAGQTLCSGVLVDRRHVLTALHCLCPAGAASVRRPHDVGYDNVEDGANRVFVPALQAVLPPGAACPWRVGMTDLMLLRLAAPLPPPAEPALIAPYGWTRSARFFLAAGYGRGNDKKVGKLNFGLLGAFSVTCDEANRRLPYDGTVFITRDTRRFGCTAPGELIAVGLEKSPENRSDTCDGDSGGPLLSFPGDLARPENSRLNPQVPRADDARLFVSAITSRVVGWQSADCGVGGIYTAITPHILEWMRQNGARPQIASADGQAIELENAPAGYRRITTTYRPRPVTLTNPRPDATKGDPKPGAGK